MADGSLAGDDPFPSIPCALLHSGHLRAYAEHGAETDQLFQPFNKDNLKSASYEINLRGTAYSWNAGSEKSEPDQKELGPGDTLEIPRNAIVFVRPKVKLKVPPYLALRFNLHIRLVHRGLLLGTGPLVDPGFEGRLLIPIHNLTDKRLIIRADDGFIWVEVTKVSPLTDAFVRNYVPFPPEKKNREPQEYFHRASGGEPIRSSIPSIAAEVDKAKASLEVHERRAHTTSVIAMVGVIIGFAGLVWTTLAIWNGTLSFVNSARTEVAPAVKKEVADNTADLRARIDSLERDLAAIRRERNGRDGKRGAN